MISSTKTPKMEVNVGRLVASFFQPGDAESGVPQTKAERAATSSAQVDRISWILGTSKSIKGYTPEI